MTRLVAFLTGMALSLAIAGTHSQAVVEWPTYPIKQAPAALQPAIQRGDLVIISIQNATSSELTRALTEGGPADAIKVCHLSAATLSQRMGREEGIAAGRTSARLRTPSNAPKPWAAPIVQKYANARAADVDGFAVDLGDRVGIMRPIVHRAVCAPCHGTEEKLSPQVREELKDRYVVDRATGFKDGDLRGWIWVEVPKPR